MILVGLTGTINSGKTTFANFLTKHEPNHGHWESGQIIAEVANGLRAHELPPSNAHNLNGLNQWLEPLPELIRKILNTEVDPEIAHISEEKVSEHPELYDRLFEYAMVVSDDPILQRGEITDANKEELRSLLQWLGGYISKMVGGDVWYNEVVRRINSTPGITIATIGGVRFPSDAQVLHARGGNVLLINRAAMISPSGEDITEREISTIRPDAIIHNDGSLANLEACAAQVYNDLISNRLCSEYTASTFKVKH